MKTIIIKNYINGLASFLDEEGIMWEKVDSETSTNDIIKIYYNTNEDLFLMGFNFGKFHENN